MVALRLSIISIMVYRYGFLVFKCTMVDLAYIIGLVPDSCLWLGPP